MNITLELQEEEKFTENKGLPSSLIQFLNRKNNPLGLRGETQRIVWLKSLFFIDSNNISLCGYKPINVCVHLVHDYSA